MMFKKLKCICILTLLLLSAATFAGACSQKEDEPEDTGDSCMIDSYKVTVTSAQYGAGSRCGRIELTVENTEGIKVPDWGFVVVRGGSDVKTHVAQYSKEEEKNRKYFTISYINTSTNDSEEVSIRVVKTTPGETSEIPVKNEEELEEYSFESTAAFDSGEITLSPCGFCCTTNAISAPWISSLVVYYKDGGEQTVLQYDTNSFVDMTDGNFIKRYQVYLPLLTYRSELTGNIHFSWYLGDFSQIEKISIDGMMFYFSKAAAKEAGADKSPAESVLYLMRDSVKRLPAMSGSFIYYDGGDEVATSVDYEIDPEEGYYYEHATDTVEEWEADYHEPPETFKYAAPSLSPLELADFLEENQGWTVERSVRFGRESWLIYGQFEEEVSWRSARASEFEIYVDRETGMVYEYRFKNPSVSEGDVAYLTTLELDIHHD